jgi:hypothetical protein
MKTFKQKSLYAALAGVTALGVTSAAQAVNVNPDGLGQVLIYPYYTVRDKVAGAPFSSLLTVVNSTASAKAVKVRFIEGKNSQEVLDFNLFLSAHDVWTAAVLATASGGAGVGTFDKSCTIPTVSSDVNNLSEFVNVLLDDAVGDDSLDRTKEGYAEIIEMGTIIGGTKTETAVTHVAGVPPCTASALTDAVVPTAITSPTGGLFGDMTLINVLAGEDYTEDAVALDNFRNVGVYDTPGSIKPDLQDVNPPTSVVVNNNNVYQSTFLPGFDSQPIDAISALFMHDHVYNTFILDSGTKSGTDWVLTFPTKRYYYTFGSKNQGVQYLFQRNIVANTGGCDDVSITIYDREEASATPSVGFSPQRPGKANTLCWEANVLTFNASQVLGSTNNRNVVTTYQNGWANLSFTLASNATSDGNSPHSLTNFNTTITNIGGGSTSGTTVSYIGLPVIGFAVESYNNGTLTGANGSQVQSQYGGNFVHKGTRSILQTFIP